MDDINMKILQQGFGVRLISSYRTRTGLVCRTDRGLLELKRTFSDDIGLETEAALKEYLVSRGFDGLDRAYRTTDGMPCFRTEDAAYILIKYVPSERLEAENTDDLSVMADTLARFHNAAEGFEAEGLRRAAGSPEDVFSKRAAEFTRIRKRIKTFGDYTKVDLLVIKYYDYYMERIKEAEELLKNAGLPEAATETDERKLVCHNAFKNDNVRKSADGRVIVSGLDGCTRDMSAGDVAHLIRRYIKNPAASQDGIRTVLESYSAKRPLSEAELGIIRGMLIFPYKFLKLCNEHYNKRRVCISEAAVERFENCVSSGDREVRLAGGV